MLSNKFGAYVALTTHKAIMLCKIPQQHVVLVHLKLHSSCYNYARNFLSSNLSAVTQTQAWQTFDKKLRNNNFSAHIPQTATTGGLGSEILVGGNFLLGDGNLKMSNFHHSNIFQS